MSKKKKLSKAFREHMEKRIHAFKEGEMHSRKQRTGPVVTEKKQALRIALEEAREKGLKGVKPAPKKKSSANPNIYEHIARM